MAGHLSSYFPLSLSFLIFKMGIILFIIYIIYIYNIYIYIIYINSCCIVYQSGN